MTKKLLITSTDLMMVQFLLPHVANLSDTGFEIDLACSNVGDRLDEVIEKIQNKVNSIYTVDLKRNPASLSNFKGYRQMKEIISSNYYDIIWTNEPVMGVVTRLAAQDARKKGTFVLYMVHGFHFYRGAPFYYWMIFYPIERIMASKADVICTINREDYNNAKKMNVKRVEYIHGIGINTDRLTPRNNISSIRKELNIPEEAFLVLSVGELNRNKSQKTIIEALSILNDTSVHYLLCGKGSEMEALKELTRCKQPTNNIHFLGYRMDVVDICSQSDVFVMPSHREGLPVSSLEAMYCGLPLVTSEIRGLVDIMEEGVTGFLCKPDDVDEFAMAIKKLKSSPQLRKDMSTENKKRVVPFCIQNTKEEVLQLLNSLK